MLIFYMKKKLLINNFSYNKFENNYYKKIKFTQNYKPYKMLRWKKIKNTTKNSGIP